MKLNKLIPALSISVLLVAGGCEKTFEELEKDPNKAVNVPASLVLQGIEADLYNNTGRPFSAEMRWNQYFCSNYNYYATNEYTWTEMTSHYFTLKNVVKMEEEALRSGAAAVNPYASLGKFFRSFFFDQMSKRVGDLPLSEALKGNSNTHPLYDTQKNVYVQILKWLEEANDDLASLIAKGETSVSGDFYYGGDLRKWQKAVNALHLRILITLSKKESEADLSVRSKFAQIIGNPTKYPLFESASESLQFISNNFNKYPSNPDNFGFDATRQNMAKAYIQALTDRKDPRVMKTCEPAGFELKSGKLPSDFTAYVGASSGEDLADMASNAGVNNGTGFAPGKYSFQNRNRYYTTYAGEPATLIGYPEMCFNIAEGLHRGWVTTGSAEEWYKKGVQASIAFYGINEGSNTMTYSKNGGRDASDFATFSIAFNFDNYYNQANVKYTADAKGLEQIITQKYLAFFMNSGMEAYFNWRRTGYPQFYTGVGTGNSGRIAIRWQYPVSEITTNPDNYKKAIDSQFGGKDTINETIWLLK